MEVTPCIFCKGHGADVAITAKGVTGVRYDDCNLIYLSPRPSGSADDYIRDISRFKYQKIPRLQCIVDTAGRQIVRVAPIFKEALKAVLSLRKSLSYEMWRDFSPARMAVEAARCCQEEFGTVVTSAVVR